jgi:hypothetical protein
VTYSAGGAGITLGGTATGSSAAANSGGGGNGGKAERGAGFTGNTYGPGGTGGSGVVIIKYSDAFKAATTTGSPTYTVSGGFRIYRFTGSGSITW